MRGGTPPPLVLEALDEKHPIAAFSSGDAAIDLFLHSQALAEQEIGLSSVTVALDRINGELRGFFSLSPMSIAIDPRLLAALDLPADKIPYPRIGGYLLGRLGVEESFQGQGLGAALVAIAFDQARRGRADTGGVFLAVDAKTDRLVEWYRKLGFSPLGGAKRLIIKL